MIESLAHTRTHTHTHSPSHRLLSAAKELWAERWVEEDNWHFGKKLPLYSSLWHPGWTGYVTSIFFTLMWYLGGNRESLTKNTVLCWLLPWYCSWICWMYLYICWWINVQRIEYVGQMGIVALRWTVFTGQDEPRCVPLTLMKRLFTFRSAGTPV